MKKVLMTAAVLVAAIATASAQFGKFMPAEKKVVKDPQTGVALTVLTNTDNHDKYLYQTDPMWTPDGKYLLFRSSSRGTGEPLKRTTPDGRTVEYRPTYTYFVEIATGRIIQATDETAGSVFLANKSNKMFVSKNEDGKFNMYVMDLNKFFADANRNATKPFNSYLTYLASFPTDNKELGRPGGWCVNSDDTFAYFTVSREGTPEEIEAMKAKAFKPLDNQPVKVSPALSGLRKMNLKTGEVSIIVNADFRMGHIQASRFRPEEILVCCETGGDADQRMWYANANTKELKPLYAETPLDWVTHETFGTEDWVYFNVLGWQDRLRKQANGIFRINLRTDDVECLGNVEMDADRSSALTGRGFWHCNSSRDNQWACGDTFAGSVWIIHVPTGHKIQIASDLKMKPDHAHPFFSPDGTKLCFQSGHYSNAERLNLVMVDLTKIPFFKEYHK